VADLGVEVCHALADGLDLDLHCAVLSG
jgi:hypothetical protein